MSITSKFYQLEKPLNLIKLDNTPIQFNNVTLHLFTQDNQIIECRLTLTVTSEKYQQLKQNCLFNLKSEVCSPFQGGSFQTDKNIQILVTLTPNLLATLPENAINLEILANYFQQLNTSLLDVSPLIQTENWLCLSVKQQQQEKEVGYTTIWDFLNPVSLSQADSSEEVIKDNIVNFVQQWVETNLSEITENSVTALFSNIGDVFRDLVDETFVDTETDLSLFEKVTNFFSEDDWTFIEHPEQSSLTLSCRGENGQWTCYGVVRELAKQFIFYSLCPLMTPPQQRLIVAEFICRANYGMIIGNFELDWDDGEIRYKTSIDVDQDRLSNSLIKQMVYANITTMDQYLPGILAVIQGKSTVQDAITLVEN